MIQSVNTSSNPLLHASSSVRDQLSEWQGRQVVHVDPSFHAEDVRAGGVDAHMFDGIGKALAIMFIALPAIAVAIATGLVSGSFQTAMVSGGITAASVAAMVALLFR